MKELELYLKKYKEYTVKIISCLEDGEYDLLNELLIQRGNIIKKICDLECSKEEFKNKFSIMGLAELDEKMRNILIEKRDKIKNEMEKLNKSKNSTISYSRGFYRGSGIFSKKV